MIGEQGKRTFPFPSFFPLLSLSGGEEKFGKNICPLGGAFKIRCSSTQSTSAPMVSLCIVLLDQCVTICDDLLFLVTIGDHL